MHLYKYLPTCLRPTYTNTLIYLSSLNTYITNKHVYRYSVCVCVCVCARAKHNPSNTSKQPSWETVFNFTMFSYILTRISAYELSWISITLLLHVCIMSYFSFQPVLHDWCNKGRGMCYPVYGMVHIKEPMLLIGKSSLCGGSGFPFSLSE